MEVVGPDGGEFVGRAEAQTEGRQAVQDAEVDEVAQVGPDADEDGEVGPCEDGVEVVEAFGSLRGGWS